MRVKFWLHWVGSPWEVNEGNVAHPFSSWKTALTPTGSSDKNPAAILDFALALTLQSSLASKRNPKSNRFSFCPRTHHCLCPGDENSFLSGCLLLYCPVISSSHSSSGGLLKPTSQILRLPFVKASTIIPTCFLKMC